MNAFDWIHRAQVLPHNKKVTYPRYIVNICPENQKTIEPESQQEATDWTITAMCQHTQHQWRSSRPTGTVSFQHPTHIIVMGAFPICICSMLDDGEYVQFPVQLILSNIIAPYKLQPLKRNGYVYARIKKVWYRLKYSGKIMHDNCVAH